MALSKRELKQEILAFPVQLATEDGAWLDFDGIWSTFNLQVGSDDGGQHFDAIVSTSSFSTWLPIPGGCDMQALQNNENVTLPSNAPSNQADCAQSRGVGLFRQMQSPGYQASKDASQTWQFGGLPSFIDLGQDLKASSLFGSMYYYEFATYYDFLFLNSVSSPGVQLNSSTTVPILGDNGWLYYLPTIGLGFGRRESNDTSTFMSNLAATGMIPSQTWGYTAGAHYHENGPYTGSLVLGGYDSKRIVESTTAKFNMPSGSDKTELKLSVNTISIDFNDNPNPNPNQRPNESWPTPFDVVIDSTLPYLILPKETCQWMAERFNLTWDEYTGLYILDNSTANNNILYTKTIRFALADLTKKEDVKTTIEFRYDAFVAEASWRWLFPTPQLIFPMRNMTDENGPGVLGRAFLQEAYLSANYDPLPDGQYFNVSQASFPAPAATQIVTIHSSKSPSNNSKSGLKAGAIAGIAIGAAIAVTACIFALWWFCFRKKKEKSKDMGETKGEDALEGFPSYEERPRGARRDTVESNWSDQTYGRSEVSATSPRPDGPPRHVSELSTDSERWQGGIGMAKIHEVHEMDVEEKDKSETARLQEFANARRFNSDSSVPTLPLHELEARSPRNEFP